MLDRGRYLVGGIAACGNCHTPKGPDGKPIADRELSGGAPMDSPVFHAIPANITPDPETGVGKWTDAEIVDAIRNGRRPDGTLIGPPMAIAFYRDMSDEDVKAIVTYLRQVRPVVNKTDASTYKIPLPPSYGPPVTHAPDVVRDDPVAYGRYLATGLGHCMDCHTPRVKGRADMARIGAGGNDYSAPGGGTVTSPNLTPANPDGIAQWSDAQLKTAIREGLRPDGSRLVRLMAFDWYENVDDADMNALVAFLRSLKPAK
ncbi:c-type cytochrome [Methylocapsa sp. S129]|uniref:c-type cytochrome n=1 Tax=Methylocapsa sp. S129 TaxID=1641869 RepID=UPI001AEE30A0|nr:c-type cytochrome [Methylocapsa sp. S129]